MHVWKDRNGVHIDRPAKPASGLDAVFAGWPLESPAEYRQSSDLFLYRHFREIDSQRTTVGFGLARWVIVHLHHQIRVLLESHAGTFGQRLRLSADGPATDATGRDE